MDDKTKKKVYIKISNNILGPFFVNRRHTNYHKLSSNVQKGLFPPPQKIESVIMEGCDVLGLKCSSFVSVP